jgi:hypothetical protein
MVGVLVLGSLGVLVSFGLPQGISLGDLLLEALLPFQFGGLHALSHRNLRTELIQNRLDLYESALDESVLDFELCQVLIAEILSLLLFHVLGFLLGFNLRLELAHDLDDPKTTGDEVPINRFRSF